MKLACILLSACAAAMAAPAPKQKQLDWSSSVNKVENGPRRVLKKGSKTKKDTTIKKNLRKNNTNEDLDLTPFVGCDFRTEETCYDEWYKAVSCSLISDGGCPCLEGTERCGADPANGCLGYCTTVCCDWAQNEYACYNYNPYSWPTYTEVSCGTIEDGCSCPEGQTECIKGQGFCSNACCDQATEEHCYGPNNTSFCAKLATGGCPCPQGQERCGADLVNNNIGWCTIECCDSLTDETCVEYDDGYNKPFTDQYCAAIAGGGCPCPEGQERCGADLENNLLGYCADVCCDQITEETCYNPPSCAPIAEGGCTCPIGQERCGADLANNNVGWCAIECCNSLTEETCYENTCGGAMLSDQYCVAIADGGCPCPEGTERCEADLENCNTGWCTDICCDQLTEETCYEYYPNGTSKSYCSASADGGCPCPEGTERCGADPKNNYTGWCTDICCDQMTEETCYNFLTGELYCAAIADGGCPCPEGTERCGADNETGSLGFCSNICCDFDKQLLCYDDNNWLPYCYNSTGVDDITCPVLQGGSSNGNNNNNVNSDRKLAQGNTSGESELVSYLRHLETKYENMSAINSNDRNVKEMYRQKLALKQEIDNVHRIIKIRGMPTKQSMVKNRELNFWAKI